MTVLNPTNVSGSVVSTLINPDRAASLASVYCDGVDVDFSGLANDSHAGLVRAACVRVKHQYIEGTKIRNTRQVSIVSTEELLEVAQKLDIPEVKPEWVGANLLIKGIPHLTFLPPSSRLIFPSGVGLVVDMENAPCAYPGEVIDKHHPGRGASFARTAVNRRGITAWVESEGRIEVGDKVFVHMPPARRYPRDE